jgi:hypothetical protein
MMFPWYRMKRSGHGLLYLSHIYTLRDQVEGKKGIGPSFLNECQSWQDGGIVVFFFSPYHNEGL